MSTTWRQIGEEAIRSHSFLTSVGEEGEWSTSRYGHFTPRKNTGIRWTGGWVDPRNGLDIAEKRNLTGIRNVNFSARNPLAIQTTSCSFSQDYAQSLMRLYAKTKRKDMNKMDTIFQVITTAFLWEILESNNSQKIGYTHASYSCHVLSSCIVLYQATATSTSLFSITLQFDVVLS